MGIDPATSVLSAPGLTNRGSFPSWNRGPFLCISPATRTSLCPPEPLTVPPLRTDPSPSSPSPPSLPRTARGHLPGRCPFTSGGQSRAGTPERGKQSRAEPAGPGPARGRHGRAEPRPNVQTGPAPGGPAGPARFRFRGLPATRPGQPGLEPHPSTAWRQWVGRGSCWCPETFTGRNRLGLITVRGSRGGGTAGARSLPELAVPRKPKRKIQKKEGRIPKNQRNLPVL
ncbi:ESX-1 secretion-associated protein EspI-like [Pipra filicauda]|uniref:ESX-1 secretion-associated protein EspI-like n=1 Tax=Pipra filicauda TaxID=649802 RepID=A0A7R5KYW6_9PASS|nr:ESX-1 secretion-associated protein EspI-like [Pipra filicauda]